MAYTYKYKKYEDGIKWDELSEKEWSREYKKAGMGNLMELLESKVVIVNSDEVIDNIDEGQETTIITEMQYAVKSLAKKSMIIVDDGIIYVGFHQVPSDIDLEKLSEEKAECVSMFSTMILYEDVKK